MRILFQGPAVADLEDRRQSLLTRLGEVNKGIRRIVEYIKSHDSVPAHIDRELQELDQERQQLERPIEKADLEITFRKKKILDADLMRQQLQQFEQLVKVLPLDDQKELFSLLIKEVRVYPFESDDASEALVAKVRGRLYKVEMSLYQLPGVTSLRSPNGKSSDNGKLGSPGWTTQRTFGLSLKLPEPAERPSPEAKLYSNPLVLAQEWQRRIDRREVSSRAALARELGVTRAHVTQMLRLLQLAPSVQQTILALGDPIVGRQIGMHTLRTLPRLPIAQQERRVAELIRGTSRLSAVR